MTARLITPPDTALSRLRGGGGMTLDPKDLEAAEQSIRRLSSIFPNRIRADLLKMRAEVEKLAPGTPARQSDALYGLAHDLRGDGGSFGYDLITRIANGICQVIELATLLQDRDLDILRVHVNALFLVVGKGLHGSGGPDGQTILGELDRLLVDDTKAPPS